MTNNPDFVRRKNQRALVQAFLDSARFSDCTMRELYKVFAKEFSSRLGFRRFFRLCLDCMRDDSRFVSNITGELFSKKYCREKGIVVVQD